MKPRDVEKGLIAALRRVPAGGKPHLGEIRRGIGCSSSDLRGAVDRLRRRGMLAWDRLELAPSLRDSAEAQDGGPSIAPLPPLQEAGAGLAPGVSSEASQLHARPAREQPRTLAEALQTALAEEPGDLARAIYRRHPEVWDRLIRLGRDRGERPMQALYSALEVGLATLEPKVEAGSVV